MRTVLVCEDEQAIREFVVINLQKAGYAVREAETGEAALRIFAEENSKFEIALLDIMLPGIDGFQVCSELRRSSPNIGIIMLTARTQEEDKVGGFSNGADDYITKPFSPSELVARVNSLCRRVEMNSSKSESAGDTITHGDFSLDLHKRCLIMPGKVIELTQVEFQIIEYLFRNYDKPIDRTRILNKVWGEEYFGEEKIVDVNIRRLRMKIETNPSAPEHLVTVWGKGYKWIS